MRWINTPDIQKAIEGRETDVLSALGIGWKEGRPHIKCPYPAHGGKNDWRWDEGKRRAFCTCAHGDSIFDVVMKCESVDFPESKLRVAEVIGRDDLVKQKRARAPGSDARSLLNPPPESKDGSLPTAYLAFRLGIEAGSVLMPTTVAVGWRRLPYYDAAPKPVKVAEPPCTVWEMVDCDGGKHALRIWVAPGGRGKAELGEKDGCKREPKKLARAIDGDKTTGRAVVWGNTDAEWTILCEGIETAAAVSAAFREEIECGQLLVAAAGSAVSMEAFRPWPNTRRITCAADRDEQAVDGRPPSMRGENAARNFAARNEHLDVRIALPGAPSTKADWLDVYVTEGADAVRAGVKEATSLLRVSPERTPPNNGSSAREKLDEAERLYPLPELGSDQLAYAITRDKKVRIHKTTIGRDGEPLITAVASPVGIPARLRYLEQDNSFGLRVVVEGMDGVPKSLDISRDALAASRGAEVMSTLYSAGLRIYGDGEKVVIACLKAAEPGREILVVQRAGWHRIPSSPHPFFVCPDGEAIGMPDGADLELDAARRLPTFAARNGSLEDWKRAVAVASSVENCKHWTLGIVAGFAGVVLSLASLDTCGMSFSGKTSAGKTLAQMLAISCWSSPVAGSEGLFQSARSTVNALEYTASRANGTTLALDEMSHIDGRELGKVIYTLAGNVGKGRLTSGAMPKANYRWRMFTLLSAERSLAEMIRSDGGHMAPGMALRIVDVDVTGVNRRVPRETMDQIERITEAHGHAGPAFVHALHHSGRFGRGAELRQSILEIATAIDGETVDSSVRRAGIPFATLKVTGELLKEFGLLPDTVDVEDAVDWAWKAFRVSPECETLDSEATVVNNLQAWILKNWGSTVHNVSFEYPNKAIAAWYDKHCVYIPAENIAEAAGNILKEKEIAAVLDRKGAIAKRKSADSRYVLYIPGVGKGHKAYALSRKFFGREESNLDIP